MHPPRFGLDKKEESNATIPSSSSIIPRGKKGQLSKMMPCEQASSWGAGEDPEF
jgi:hypothetical protein